MKNGLSISSCQVQNKKGICVIKKHKKEEWVKRLSALEDKINYWIDPKNTANKTIEIV